MPPSLFPPIQTTLNTRLRAPRGRPGASVPVAGLVRFADMQLDPLVGTVGVHGRAGTSLLMSAQRG